MSFLFTSESVSEGHPDKVCDAISDGVLDAIIDKDPGARVALQHPIADCVHQVCLAKTNTAVDEERVVDATRIIANLHTRSARKLIGLALHEAAEGEVGIGCRLHCR